MTERPCCMIVEDQALIAMSLEAYLEETGFQVVGPFPTKEKALEWLSSHTPELALLDVMLRDGTSVDLARELKDRGVAFAIYSGLSAGADHPPELQGVPWLEKPISREILVETLNQIRN